MRKKCDHLICGTLFNNKLIFCDGMGDYTHFNGNCHDYCAGYTNKIEERKEERKAKLQKIIENNVTKS